MYPDFFGGMYFNDDGNLVLHIVDDTNSARSAQYNAVIDFALDEDIIVEYVDFALTDLSALNEILRAFFLENGASNISRFGVDVIKNRVVIYLEKMTEDTITHFREIVMDSPLIYFREATSGVILNSCGTLNVNPGQRIEARSANGASIMQGSAGFRALRNGAPGFVTAGHTVITRPVSGIPPVSNATITRPQIFNRAGNRIGTATVSTFYRGMSADAAFVNTSAFNVDPTNEIERNQGELSRTVANDFLVGQQIVMVGSGGGSQSVLVHTGTIDNGNFDVIIGGWHFMSEAVLTNITRVRQGDSGGIVFRPASRNTGGIITGALPDDARAFFSHARNINNALGLVRY
ncbi:MAG: S1 family peptidase [Oscillospiraceae bacterium]|nr:S1 family peptidase [Oscillospiraceae bacterium]